MLNNKMNLDMMDNSTIGDNMDLSDIGFDNVAPAVEVDNTVCNNTNIDTDYEVDNISTTSTKVDTYIVNGGKFEGYVICKVTWKMYNEMKNKNNAPTNKYQPIRLLTSNEGVTIVEDKEAYRLWNSYDFKQYAKLNSTEGSVCKCCGNSSVSDKTINFIKNCLNNPNLPKEVKDQIMEYGSTGELCYNCQIFTFNGRRMKLVNIMKALKENKQNSYKEVSAFEELEKEIQSKDYPRCNKCGKVLDPNVEKEAKIIGWCENEFKKLTDGNHYCAVHLNELVNPKKK